MLALIGGSGFTNDDVVTDREEVEMTTPYGAPSAPKSIKKPKYRRRFLSYGGLTPRRKITKPAYNQKRSNKRSRVYEEQRQNITYRNAA